MPATAMPRRLVILSGVPMSRSHTAPTYLILFQTALRHHLVPLLLEGDDDQGHKDIDKEEGKHHKVDHVEDGHFHAVPGAGALVLKSGIH